MQKSELKNLVFERFEERRTELIKKRNRFQQELDQDLHQLRQAYGDAAVQGLGDLLLTVIIPETKTAMSCRTPAEPQREQLRARSKRKWQRRPAGTPAARSLLEEYVAAVAAVAERKEEFQVRDIHDHLTNVSKLDIGSGNVSLYMSQNAKKLGLTVEKRSEGEPNPRLKNFFRKRHEKDAMSKGAKPSGRVDWDAHVISVLKGLHKGLARAQLKDKLVKAGIPKEKFRAGGFRGALSRMVEQGTIILQDDRYRS